MDFDRVLASLGGIASTTQLTAAGITAHYVKRAVDEQRAIRIRQGWVSAPGAPDDAVRAIRVGGFLTCVSALRLQRVWCAPSTGLHVRVDRHANHLASPDDRAQPLASYPRPEVTLHRSFVTDRLRSDLAIDTVESALLHAALCQSRDNAVVLFDSVLNLRLGSLDWLTRRAATLTARHREVLRLVDAASQSGLESKARLRLRALGIPYRSQVHIDNVGRVDLLIGDRLVLELDGREWHTSEAAFAEDRRRDLILNERGYYVLRLTYAQVMFEWPRVESLIRALVGRREHRWSARHRRAGLCTAVTQSSARSRSVQDSRPAAARADDSRMPARLASDSAMPARLAGEDRVF